MVAARSRELTFSAGAYAATWGVCDGQRGTRRRAGAWGVDWLNNCIPSCGQGTFFPRNANVHVYRPNASGIFTRLEILSKNNKVQTRRVAVRQSGFWVWGVGDIG